MALTSGTKLGPYEIQSPLGAGGMGEVYRATDTKLGRDVALKVLPAEMAQDPERLGRFRREAKSLAQLDHPNIVTIYSVEECDGVHFLTMQLVEGQPLDRVIRASGLPVEQIVEIAGALGDALAAAHEKGIVHRDLKPANVMVSKDGRIKVLDFGLAKDISASNLSDATMTSDSRTQIGVVMGTPAYMSPEQTSGRPLDHRTDIFSLGVLLHEMTTGQRPFLGNSSAELVSAILRDNPPAVTDARPDLPSDLARIIRRCLEKDPRHRLQTARDVSNEFRDLSRQTSQKMARATSSIARAASVADSGAARADEGFWVAVLPFKYSGSNAELAALGEGLTEEVITGLSRFSYLRVIARGSTAKYSSESGDVRAIGKELGARYVMEGSIRQAGTKIRLAVQLVDAATGAGLWAETYDRPFTAESTLDLLDDVVPRIVATVGDAQGILPHSMTAALRNRDPESLTPYEAVLRSFGYHQFVNEAEHLVGIQTLERAVRQEPDRADCWAMLSWLYRAEHNPGYNTRPDPLDRALAAARRAIDLSPSHPLGNAALASALFFRREFGAFRTAVQRALALNRMEGYVTAYLGLEIAYSGDWDAGCALAERATQLNPNHPGWCWLPMALNAYRQHEAQRALEFVLRINMPGLWTVQLAVTAIYSQLGEIELARTAFRHLLVLRPELATNAPEELAKMWQPEMVEQLLADLRRAGLEIANDSAKPGPATSTNFASTTGMSGAPAAIREEEGFWVAVLPFKHADANAELKVLADGLSEEIVTGLSRFSYLRVIARGSTAKYSSESGDIRAIGKELGARYVMEGSLRQAGGKLRVAVQLVDATTGAHLWAENFERAFRSEAVFELQDDLVPRIVSTVADMNGVLPRSMSEGLRSRPPHQLSPYEAVLRSFAYTYSATPEELTAARLALEDTVRKAPAHADAWAMLSFLCGQDYVHGYELQANALETAISAARRAVALGPSNHLAYFSLGQALWCQKDYDSFRDAAERTVALNPMDGNAVAYLGELLTYAGSAERGMQLVERAKQLNPNHPGWYWFADFYHAYSEGDYRDAQSFALKAKLRGNPLAPMFLAAACGQLGDIEGGATAAAELVKFRPELPAALRKQVAKVWNPEYGERFLEGLRKAGLEIADDPAKSVPAASVTGAIGSGAKRADEGVWVAVLPFKYTGASAEIKALAEGLSEEIITGLSRFSYLRVIARGSTPKYSGEPGDVRAIGKELGARYVMEGSLRQAGSKLRLAVQLVDTVSGAHLWAETYEHAFTPESVFEIQDNLVPRIVSTVADQHGVLPRSMSEVLRNKNEDSLTPHEAALRAFSYFTRLTLEEHATIRRILENAVREAPDQADCWAMLALIYLVEYSDGFNALPNPLGRALAAAQRAVDLGQTHALGHYALAFVYFFRKEKAPFRAAVERTLALNPMDGTLIGLLGLLMHHAGEEARGLQMVDTAMHLNPNYPGLLRFTAFTDAYCHGRYAEALEAAVRINMPGFFYAHASRAAALGQLGQHDAAGKAVQDLISLRPDFGSVARAEYAKWYESEQVEHMIDGLRKAGLEIAGDPAEPGPALATAVSTSTPVVKTDSGALRADEGFWVAVLPFKSAVSSAELKGLAEGLSEEIITGLSRFSYLRVIARGSTAKYSSESGDVRAIGKELGARYVMEGSLRQAGTKLRLAVQLVDATTGAHLWAETYERDFQPDAIFALQDDLVPRIVSTVADQYGILPRSISESLRSKSEDQLTPHEAVLRTFSYFTRITPEEHAIVRRILERAVREAPDHADSWAMLSMIYRGEFAQGYNAGPNPLDRALTAAQRAVDLASTHALGHYALATVHFFRKEMVPFRVEAERALALNPLDASVRAYLGLLTACAGEWDRGCQMVESAMQLNPNCPGYFYFARCWDNYRKGKYEEALEGLAAAHMPNYFHVPAIQAAALAQLGRREEAQKAIQALLVLRPDFAAAARREYGKWYDSEHVEQVIDGLRKAGLEIPD